ncbi:MAG: methyl-accepting chemotaxis protein [Chloroflexota bacterium]|nr:methyl-accepting chemotaxis protein [Chloroflexota bacterium]
MFKILSNIPIFRRLAVIFAIAAIVPGIIILILGNFYLSSLTQRGQAVATSFDAQSIASQQQDNLERMNALTQTLHNNIFASLSRSIQDPSLSASGALINGDILSREADFQQTLKDYRSTYDLANSPNMATVRTIIQRDNPTSGVIQDQQDALNLVINHQWPAYDKLQEKVLNQLQDIETNYIQPDPKTNLARPQLTPDQINALYEQVYPNLYQANLEYATLSNSWQRVVDDAVVTGKTVTSVGPSLSQPILISTAIALFFVLLIILLAALVVNSTITRPLHRLASLTRRITEGDTSARAEIPGRDEINQVARSMNMMLDNIVQLLQITQNQHADLQAQVEKLLNEVSGVGEGDLSIEAEVTAGALGALADSFNFMVEELSNLIVRVQMVAAEVENGTSMTLQRMSQLVTSADVQIHQIMQAAGEVERMADVSRQVADRAQSLHRTAVEARQTAQIGRRSVQSTVDGIGRIQEHVQATSSKVQTLGERSRAINNVIEIIANIAHQTNRLSLDAAIQAAMAGESGKGFRAVADDIRRLAEIAKSQTYSVTQLIRAVREDIGAVAVSMKDTERETLAGTTVAQQAGQSLDALFGVVEMQAQEITVINQSARQQSLSSNTVMEIMQAVSNSTQQNSVTTHSVAQSMERLASLAQQLQSSVGAFKLREDRIDNNLDRNMLEAPRNGSQWPPSGPLRPFAGAAASGSGDNGRWNAPVATPAPGRGNNGFSQQPVPTYPNSRRAPYRMPEQGR